MKKLAFSFALFALLVSACSKPRVHKKAPQPRSENDLVTGCYYISETPAGLQRTLSGPAPEVCYILPAPIVTVGNFEEVESSEENGHQVLTVRLDEAGKAAFADATGKAKGKRLAFIIDNVLLMTPMVQDRIPGGSFTITGNFTEEEIKNYYQLLDNEMYEPN